MTSTDEARRMVVQLRSLGSSNGATKEVELPEYPLDVWPDDLASYFDAAAKCVGAPVGMIAVPASSILAALIGNSRPIIAKAGYAIPPAIWTFDLAEPGTGKSPMLGHARELVTQIQYQAKEMFEALTAEYVAALEERPRKSTDPMPEKPEPYQHYYTDNATMEALGPICETSAGIVITKDELIGWLLDQNAYRSGRGSDRQAMLTFWSGQKHAKTDRKSSGVVMPANAVVCITGSIQPGRFVELAGETAKDGLLARFLGSTYPDVVIRWTDDTLSEDDLERARAYIWPLRQAPPAMPVGLSRKAIDLYREWDTENAALTQAATGPVRHLLSKLPLHLLKLTALLHCVWDPGVREKEVSFRRVRDAIRLLEYHRQHTEYAYGMIHIPVDMKAVSIKRTILWAIERLGGTAGKDDIRVATGGHYRADILTQALDELVEEGLLTMEIIPTAGRSRLQYTSV